MAKPIDKIDGLMIMDALLQRPIAYHRVFAQMAGSVTAGLLLSQLWYWHKAVGGRWFYKTIPDIDAETGMSRWEQETAIKKLVALKLIKVEVKSLPPRRYFKLQQVNMWESLKLICGNTTERYVVIPHNTSETTRELNKGADENQIVDNYCAMPEHSREKLCIALDKTKRELADKLSKK